MFPVDRRPLIRRAKDAAVARDWHACAVACNAATHERMKYMWVGLGLKSALGPGVRGDGKTLRSLLRLASRSADHVSKLPLRTYR